MLDNDELPRPVRPSDFLVIAVSLVLNIVRTFEVFISEIYELVIYYSNRKTKENLLWQGMTRDLETLEEETDGR